MSGRFGCLTSPSARKWYPVGVRSIFLSIILLCGCASLGRHERAVLAAQAAKASTDLLYEQWDGRFRERIAECERRLPPTEHTKSEFDTCTEPFTVQRQSQIVAGLQLVKAKQLAVYLLLQKDASEEQIAAAMADLRSAVQSFVYLVGEDRD